MAEEDDVVWYIENVVRDRNNKKCKTCVRRKTCKTTCYKHNRYVFDWEAYYHDNREAIDKWLEQEKRSWAVQIAGRRLLLSK